MGVQDRDWYKEAMREREGWFPKGRRIYRPRSRQPTPWILKLAIALAALIAAAAVWRYFR